MNHAAVALAAQIMVYICILLALINLIFIRQEILKLRKLIYEKAELKDFVLQDPKSGIGIVGIEKQLFFCCTCGFSSPYFIREECPKCHLKFVVPPKTRGLLKKLASEIGKITMQDIDQELASLNPTISPQ